MNLRALSGSLRSPSRYSLEDDVRSVRAEPGVVGLDRHVTEEVAKLCGGRIEGPLSVEPVGPSCQVGL